MGWLGCHRVHRRHAFRTAEQYQFGHCCTGQDYWIFPAGDPWSHHCLHRQSADKAVLLPGASKDETPPTALVSVCLSLFCAAPCGVSAARRQESPDRGQEVCIKVLPENTSLVFMDFVLRCDTILVTYISQSFMDALIIGSVNAIFMAICKMPYIGLISVVVGVTNLIPNLGPAIGAVIGAYILLLAGPGNTLPFLVFCLILQSVDAYILKPRLFSNALGVSGVSILISTIVFGNMFGILGVVIAIPVAAILSFAYQEYFMKSK